MPKLKDFPIMDFSGGLVLNKADFQMERNEIRDSLNTVVEDKGRLKRRRGYQQMGDTITGGTFSGTIQNAYSALIETLGSDPVPLFLINDERGGANIFRLVATSFLTAALNDGDTTLDVQDATNFLGATDIFEVNGDQITYTGLAASQFTITESTIISGASYPIGTPVNQWSAAVTVGAILAQDGVYYALLNGSIVINGHGTATTTDGSTISPVTDDDQPDGMFATNYRDRIYMAGGGAADGADTRNGSPIRVSFSDAGDATSWTLANFFDVEDQRGEQITGFTVLNDKLLIFKANSIFIFDEVQLKIVQSSVGAYSHYNIQEIDGSVYTFCPQGIFKTNGFDSVRISDPVNDYIKDFRPNYETTVGAADIGRIVRNTYSWTFEKKYYTYLKDLENPKSRNDVVLVYDTVLNNWTVWDGFDDFRNIVTLNGFSNAQTWQPKEAVFGMDDGGKIYRMFNNQITTDSVITTGGDIIADNIADSTGVPISTVVETKWYDLGNPMWWKRFGYLRAFIEQGEYHISYKLDKGEGEGDWISLGDYKKSNQRKKFLSKQGQDQGYRIKFLITSNSKDTLNILNGLIIEESEAITKKERHG